MSDTDGCTLRMYLIPLNCTFKGGKFYVKCTLPHLEKKKNTEIRLLHWIKHQLIPIV